MVAGCRIGREGDKKTYRISRCLKNINLVTWIPQEAINRISNPKYLIYLQVRDWIYVYLLDHVILFLNPSTSHWRVSHWILNHHSLISSMTLPGGQTTCSQDRWIFHIWNKENVEKNAIQKFKLIRFKL